ncbi:hypothetical protein CONPUDRAFT_153090 [Coniophora puteana RWD-64-598 SS2]|uniref:Asl1-like glycosyl hydrolase catalytic domain-containing protein n=1 Tax=Coniophora puteana (strain RWD-64-598) TaxID=741705 RepID=A0A5M3MSR1_CONPW|nr:uncharacterized protein CONPUDRAFT_153090 [Coniophora puteana RWD-64-598 SS2]EIW82202.1 hypothetical protein CONPUDRAFT_153090 [Coniophora puteana RWD-64-598 SS2]
MASKFLNLVSLTSLAVLALSSFEAVGATSVDRGHVARHAAAAHHARGHDAVAKRKRQSSGSSCKPRPSSSLSSAPTSSAPAPITSAPAPTSSAPAPSSAPASSASSAAPSPSSSPATNNSKKWGLGWPNGDASWLNNFAELGNIGYIYTWSPSLPSNIPDGVEGIPMVWGWNQVSEFQQTVVAGYAKYALGPNEPNEPSQSNMSPGSAAQLWRQYLEPLVNQGYTLISPACTNDQAGLDWYQQFFQTCPDCTVHAIAFHCYTTDAQNCIDFAQQLYDTYGKPVWITEFADQNFTGDGGQASMDEIWGFASQLKDWVNGTPWLEAAFPFGVMNDLQGVNTLNALLNTADNMPTDLAYSYFG